MMSNETKRDVFNKLSAAYLEDEKRLDKLVNESDEHIPELDFMYFNKSYDVALPDDLPVIPKAVGEWLKNCKHDECDLVDAIVSSVNSIITSRRVTRWMEDHFETFARAWVLGVWRIEETGEIVRVEEEK